jgi:hypothetical protein
MVRNGKMGAPTTFAGKTVDVVNFHETLVVASTKFRIYVEANTATPVQYYTEFFEGAKNLGYNVRAFPQCALFLRRADTVLLRLSVAPPPPRARALQEVNMTAFTPGRPDSSVFEVPDQSRINTCDDNVCTSYARNRQAGKNPIMAFEGWL